MEAAGNLIESNLICAVVMEALSERAEESPGSEDVAPGL